MTQLEIVLLYLASIALRIPRIKERWIAPLLRGPEWFFDVAVAPDAQMTFVSSRDPNKPAIYGIPNVRLLGDSLAAPPAGVPYGGPPPPLQLTDLFACALPQPPEALTIATFEPAMYELVETFAATKG